MYYQFEFQFSWTVQISLLWLQGSYYLLVDTDSPLLYNTFRIAVISLGESLFSSERWLENCYFGVFNIHCNTDVSQGLVLMPLFFLICINDLPDEIQSICKIFASGKSLFPKCHNFQEFKQELEKDFTINKNYLFKWKMDFYLDPKKAYFWGLFSKQNCKQQPKTTFSLSRPISSSNIWKSWASWFNSTR